MKKLYKLKTTGLLGFCSQKSFLAVVLFVFTAPLFAQDSYCIPSSTYVSGNGITNVTIGTINNTTTTETNNYGDYSGQVATIGQGVVQMFSITLYTSEAYNIKIWVDWNNNFIFDEAEEVYSGTADRSTTAEFRGTFTVPATAALGSHRLRIGGILDWAGTATPCSTDDFSTVFEDYTINVTTPPTCATPTNAIGSVTAPGSATISWSAPATGALPTGYEYVVSTSSVLPTVSGTAIAATTATITIENNVFYYLHVRSNCGGGDYSQWITSARFRYTLGDTCATAINLQTLSSPYTFSTVGANDDYTNSCTDSTAPDIFYAVELPVGYILNMQQTGADYDSMHTIFYGNCTAGTTLECSAYGNSGIVWENTTGATQTLYWVQYGFGNAGTFTLEWTLTPPPACNIPRNVSGTMTSLTTANISWTLPVTGTPIGYEYAVTQSQAPPAAGIATTNLAVTGVTTAANTLNYVHVRTKCGANEFSEWVRYEFYSGHCVPGSLYLNYYNIMSFNTINGTANIANNVAQNTAYTNNFDTMAVGQQPGNAFNYAVQVDDYTSVGIWVDWNNDLDFNDPDELVATHEYAGVNETYTGSITIPATTPPGNYRMRVRSRDARFADPCAVYNYGTAQDYAIAVGNAPTCFNPVNVTGTATSAGTGTLSWSHENFGTAPLGYEYAVTTSSSLPDAGTATTNTTIENYPGLVNGTYYYLHVRTDCGNGDHSQWVTSLRFRYLAGDTCETAINLTPLTSPYTSTTVGAANDYSAVCAGNAYAPDMVYYLEVPNGYTLVTQLVTSDYNSNYSIFYGDCVNQSPIQCLQSGGFPVSWQNRTGSDQNVYWVQDGGGTDAGEFTISWDFQLPPACDYPLNLAANSTSLTSATVSWDLPNTGTPAGYDYAVTQSDTSPEAGYAYTTALSATNVTVVANATNYLHVRSNCGETDGTSVWTYIPFYSGYCVPENSDASYYITGVSTIGAETNFTNTGTGFSAYTDYTAQYGVTSYPGGSFTIQATTPVATDQYLYSVWVDWNNDFDFTDNGERIVNNVLATSPAMLNNIIIPVQAALGSYRMRIRNLHTGSPVNPCGMADGEAEDYMLNITAAPSCLPPANISINPTDVGYANLNWSPPLLGGTPVGYEYVFSTTATPPAPDTAVTATGSFFVGDAEYDPAQSVYLFVRSVCGEGDFSSWTAPASILGTNAPVLLSNSVLVYKEANSINVTCSTALITAITIYDTMGRILYNETGINNTMATISGLQIQQQVVITEVTTTKGKVSRRIVF